MIEEMRVSAAEIIEQLQHRGVDYGDVRVENVDLESIAFRKQRLAETELQANQGIGIRVLVNSCWGFASCSGFETALIE